MGILYKFLKPIVNKAIKEYLAEEASEFEKNKVKIKTTNSKGLEKIQKYLKNDLTGFTMIIEYKSKSFGTVETIRIEGIKKVYQWLLEPKTPEEMEYIEGSGIHIACVDELKIVRTEYISLVGFEKASEKEFIDICGMLLIEIKRFPELIF